MTPRTCRDCSGRYFEGGTTAGIGLVAVGGALATSVSSSTHLPEWAPLPIAFGAAALALAYTHLRQPRKLEELRSRIVAALITAPVVAIIVWKVLEAVA
jgi:ABC-type Fe3+-siderophore transport system permease subunit